MRTVARSGSCPTVGAPPQDGAPTQEVVVLVHGYISDPRIWSGVLEAWHAGGQPLTPALGGFWDGSGTFSPEAFGTDAHIEQLGRFIDGTSARRVHLVGWSYGATLALLTAAERPQLVASVFAYEPGISAFVSAPDIAEAIVADRAAMAGPALRALRAGDLHEAVKQIVDGACAQDGTFERLDPAARQVFLDNAPTVPQMFATSRPPDVRPAAHVSTISCPVTLSIGERARPAYRLIAVAAADLIPAATLQVIPGATHVAPVAMPEAFRDSVLAHLTHPTPQES